VRVNRKWSPLLVSRVGNLPTLCVWRAAGLRPCICVRSRPADPTCQKQIPWSAQTRPRGAAKVGDHFSRQAVSVVRPRAEVAEFFWRFHLGESHVGDGELVLGRARLLRRGFRLAVKTNVLGWHVAIRRCVNPADPPRSRNAGQRRQTSRAGSSDHDRTQSQSACGLVAGRVIAHTRNALMLREAAHSKVGPD
jgi:hypothetical protein